MSDVPAATVVQDGKLGGDVPSGKAPKYKRRISNYLLDKSLQLRYVLLVTILSGLISGSLGYLIYQQRHTASESLESDLAELTQNYAAFEDLKEQVEHLWMGFLDLVKQDDAVRVGTHRPGKLSLLVVADVAWRRPDQP